MEIIILLRPFSGTNNYNPRFMMKNFLLLGLVVTVIFSCKRSTQEEAFAGYLFAYFVGNGPGEEAIHYALSKDGYNYTALNGNKPIIDSKIASTSGGLRDPHILRRADGKGFYMVATDLYVPEQGWNNYAMVLMKSPDLINWTSTKINIPEMYPEEFGNIDRVWAPQTIYDKEGDRFMVYWSMHTKDTPDIIYYAYANKDFTGFLTMPKQLYYSPTNSACIDGDIIFHNNKYHLFFKNEDVDKKGIVKAISDNLTEGYIEIKGDVDQTDEQVEGSAIFQQKDGSYILMYDVYTKGEYQFCRSWDLEKFEIIDDEINMDFHPRHGSVLPVTLEEYNELLKKWGN